MARISCEDAVEKIGNRFELVLAASQRARELASGHARRVVEKDATHTVTALREIEQGKYTRDEWLSSIKGKHLEKGKK